MSPYILLNVSDSCIYGSLLSFFFPKKKEKKEFFVAQFLLELHNK